MIAYDDGHEYVELAVPRRYRLSIATVARAASGAAAGPPLCLLLSGWGAFNLVEGLIDHQLLGVHHVRDDLGGPLGWDLAFVALGILLVAAGVALTTSGQRSSVQQITSGSPPGTLL